MWTCRSCKEDSEDNFDVCWNCGIGRDGAAPQNPEVFEEIHEGADVAAGATAVRTRTRRRSVRGGGEPSYSNTVSHPIASLLVPTLYIAAVVVAVLSVVAGVRELTIDYGNGPVADIQHEESIRNAIVLFASGGLFTLLLFAVAEGLNLLHSIERNTRRQP